MADAPADVQSFKAQLRELARKNRVAQPDKDAVSRRVVAAVQALPEYACKRRRRDGAPRSSFTAQSVPPARNSR